MRISLNFMLSTSSLHFFLLSIFVTDIVTSSGPLRPYLSNKGGSTSRTTFSSPSDSPSPTNNDSNMTMDRDGLAKTEAVTNILDYLLRDYDKRIRPHFGGAGIKVGVTVYVNNILSMSESNMEFSIDFYFRQYWNDPRLKFEPFDRSKPLNDSSAQPVSEISLTREFSESIWQPDTFFSNEKRSYVPTATVHNEFIRLYSNGQVLKSTRLTLTAGCPMYLLYFPADIQPCRVEFGSYGYTDKDIEYFWPHLPSSVEMWWEALTLPQFEVKGYRQRNRTSMTATGNYSHLYMEFLFDRRLNFHLIQSYIPPTLVVIISWLVFWMGREVIVERMALGVTSVLTITTILMANNANSPKIGYLRSIDIFLGVCFTLVFASLLESSILGFLCRKLKKKLETATSTQEELESEANQREQKVDVTERRNYLIRENMTESFDLGDVSSKKEEVYLAGGRVATSKLNPTSNKPKEGSRRWTSRWSRIFKISTLDSLSRTIFPVGFALFVILYWWFFVHAVQDTYLDWHSAKWDKIEESGWDLRYSNQ